MKTSRNTLSKEDRRAKHLRLAYQWTDSIWFHNLLMQGMCCAICGSETPQHKTYPFVVDHNHETGEPRGLLCHPCNVAVGMFKEDQTTMQNAISYLAKYA
jgi:hypothetical protein